MDARLRQLEGLVLHPREGLEVEHKGWIDISSGSEGSNGEKAALAQAALALTNYGGGHIVIGFAEVDGVYVPAADRPSTLAGYTQDDVNGIVNKYADPAFHCEVHHVPHPRTGELFPVIVVPGAQSVPVRCKKDGPNGRHVKQNVYYIRRPGPCSEAIQTAQEWGDLIDRCVRSRRQDLLDSIRLIMLGADVQQRPGPAPDDRASLQAWHDESLGRFRAVVGARFDDGIGPYRHGYWTIAYKIGGIAERRGLPEYRNILERAVRPNTGWPLWNFQVEDGRRAQPRDGVIEHWQLSGEPDADASYGDFWRARPDGSGFLVRGFQEDQRGNRDAPGTALDIGLPIWRIGEALDYVSALARELGMADAGVTVMATWTGLDGRVLKNWSNRAQDWNPFSQYGPAATNDASSMRVVEVEAIDTNLQELVVQVLGPLYEVFNFYEVSPQRVQHELASYRGR
jgi:hypothetical protein